MFGSDWDDLMELAELRKKAKEKEVVIKPWGKYKTIYIGSGFKVKVITVNPGHRLSLQRHKLRHEHWFVVKGYGVGTDSMGEFVMLTGYSYNIQQDVWHRVENNEDMPLVFVETQLGNCVEEDIERKEDDYGRA